MDLFGALLLGLVQGLTEFLPVSSTGHLILARDFLGLSTENGLAFDAVLHLATLLAVLLYFRKDISALGKTLINFILRKPTEYAQRMLLFAILLGSIPAGILGILFQDTIEGALRSTTAVAWVLLAGSALFLIAEWVGKRYQEKQAVTAKKGIVIGLFQALALMPGMSRSGATISGGLMLGLSREEAARFAFLLSIPVILGAGLLKFMELGESGALAAQAGPIFVAALTAFLSGLAAIHFLLKFLKNHTLIPFVIYRVALAAIILTVSL